MIVHIPHDGQWVPDGLGAFDGTVTPLRDYGARQVFEGGVGTCLVFPADRLVCDPERFLEGEPMESVGMGVCYERNAELGHLRSVSPTMRDLIVSRLYEPHHARLAALVDEEVERLGRCLIIDGHTFSAVKRGYETSDARPQIDVGHDGDPASLPVADLIVRVLSEWYEVSVNVPFAGSLRPLDRMGDERVASVMIEVRQDLDMERARERIQSAMASAARLFYGGDGSGPHADQTPCPTSGADGEGVFSDAERHRRIDALAEKYAYVAGFADVAYGSWDEAGLGSDRLREIEQVAHAMMAGDDAAR